MGGGGFLGWSKEDVNMTPGKVYKYQNLKNLSPTKFDFLSKFENTTNFFIKSANFLHFVCFTLYTKRKCSQLKMGAKRPESLVIDIYL